MVNKLWNSYAIEPRMMSATSQRLQLRDNSGKCSFVIRRNQPTRFDGIKGRLVDMNKNAPVDEMTLGVLNSAGDYTRRRMGPYNMTFYAFGNTMASGRQIESVRVNREPRG